LKELELSIHYKYWFPLPHHFPHLTQFKLILIPYHGFNARGQEREAVWDVDYSSKKDYLDFLRQCKYIHEI
jgi:hypothetical protein